MQPWTEAYADVVVGLAIIAAVAAGLAVVTHVVAKDLTDRKDD